MENENVPQLVRQKWHGGYNTKQFLDSEKYCSKMHLEIGPNLLRILVNNIHLMSLLMLPWEYKSYKLDRSETSVCI